MIILARSLLFAFTATQRALLDSQYHAHGPLNSTISRPAELLFSERGRQLSSTLQNLQLIRKAYLQSQSKDSKRYTQTYMILCRYLEEGFLPDPSIYRLAGWYNIQSLHKKLLEHLIALKEQPEPLIESLAWMKLPPKGDYGFIEKDLREKGKIEGLYRNLKPSLSIQHLRLLNSIIMSPLTLSKRIYMQNYALKNILELLKGGKERGTDIIWLFETITASMIDREDLTSQFQQFLKTFTSVSYTDCQSLMRTYSLRGRIDKIIYQSLIRPHLYRYNMKDAKGIIEAIKFTVLSETQDYQFLKNLFELLGKESPSNSKQLYELHIITHYLRVKGKSLQLEQRLQKKLIDFCRLRSEAKSTINNLITETDTTKKRKEDNQYISECLHVVNHRLNELQASKRSVFEDAFSSRLSNLVTGNMSLYEKASFCCFELDFCLHDPASQQIIDLEVQGMQYVFSSDRLARWQQIRQELLQYYGIKVNRLKYYEFIEKPYLNCAELPPKKGKFFRKK